MIQSAESSTRYVMQFFPSHQDTSNASVVVFPSVVLVVVVRHGPRQKGLHENDMTGASYHPRGKRECAQETKG
ncbi:hypothetical protein EBZ80_12260 [bacterium]|nr:hypothetical protein [bacterium]